MIVNQTKVIVFAAAVLLYGTAAFIIKIYHLQAAVSAYGRTR